MAVSKAQQKAQNKWIAKAYDRVNLTLPKGQKEVVQAHAAAFGESVNGFIGRAISETMERDGGGTASEIAGKPPESTAGAGVVSLPSKTLKTAQEAAQATGETVPQFIERAVETQAQEDTRVRLNDDRQDQTVAGLVREIGDTELLVTSTLWGNIFYNNKLYKKPKDAQKVHDALVECKQHIGAMLDNLIEKIGSQGIKPDRRG